MVQSEAWTAAARLLRRTGFGTTGRVVDAAVRQGTAAHLRQILAADARVDPGVRATPAPRFDPVAAPGKNATKEQRAAHNKQLAEQLDALTAWWLRRMVAAEQPFGEKLTFLWHNHFATSAQKVQQAPLMLAQNEKLRSLGRGDFRALAYAMLTDAAMLHWLDGEKNTAKAPNENLSREFIELFTLGQGNGYTESDVRDGARALTGWRINPDGSTTMRPNLHDERPKTLLGSTGNLDAAGFCDTVLSQPASARFVISRTWQQLASSTPPNPELLDRLVQAYGPRRDLAAVLSAMLGAPEFPAAQNSVIVGPVEWLIGAVRALQVPITSNAAIAKVVAALRLLGQIPFYPPSVGGWPAGQAWLSTAAADARMQTAMALAGTGDLGPVRAAPTGERLDATGYLLGVGAWSARSTEVLRKAANDPVALVGIALNTPEYLTN